MVLVGQIGFYLGLLLTSIGVIAGFGFMFAGVDHWAKFCFMVVPAGFLLLFAGLTTGILFSSIREPVREQLSENSEKS